MLGKEVPFVRSDLLDGAYQGPFSPDHMPFRPRLDQRMRSDLDRRHEFERKYFLPRTGWEPVAPKMDPLAPLDFWPAQLRDDITQHMLDLMRSGHSPDEVDSQVEQMRERHRRLLTPPFEPW